MTRPKTVVALLLGCRAAALKGVPSASMRCMITASRRGQRHLGFVHAGAPFDPHGPALQLRTAFDRLGQHDVGGLVKRRAHRSITDLADPAGVVGLAGLMLLRSQPEMGSCLLRRFEPGRIVDRAGIGQRHDRADRRD